MEKETFMFYDYVEVTTLTSYCYAIEAASLEEATALITEAYKRGKIARLDEWNVDLFDADILRETTNSQKLCTVYGDVICEI